jgi:hypothetical protein
MPVGTFTPLRIPHAAPISPRHQTGAERTIPKQTGPEQTGPEQTGPEQTGPEQTGPEQTRQGTG